MFGLSAQTGTQGREVRTDNKTTKGCKEKLELELLHRSSDTVLRR